ncbi:MAG: 3-dehydroquinate synthase [Legionella sp.]|nr:3-dehydroquinate synthase [Legionella sp.]
MVSLNILQTIDITLPNACYSIVIGQHLLEDAVQLKALIKGTQVLVVTNQTIAPLYLDKLCHALQNFQCDTVILPDGEAYKNQASVTKIHEALIKHQHHRDTTLIALGGGVIGDLTGFAASTYHRGVAFIQMPTTLLAAVDAAVGGKTAINYPGAKNAVGSFYQPKAVFIDLICFNSLPKREFQSGFAEVIKYALLSGDLALSKKPLPELIATCCQIKASMIADDVEDKTGQRALLNLGHTFAHALEAHTNYTRWLHGEAVAIGLYYAVLLSHQIGDLDKALVKQVDDLLAYHELPRRIPHDIKINALYDFMQQDKKVTNNRILFILIKALGNCYTNDKITKKDIYDLY